jgi:transcriptional regulator with XRE-family HTH domain
LVCGRQKVAVSGILRWYYPVKQRIYVNHAPDIAGPTSDFGVLLRRIRTSVGLTQEELAERAALSVRGISDLERGVNKKPREDTVQRLVDSLPLSADQRSALEIAARIRTGKSEDLGNRFDLPPAGYLGAPAAGPLVAREEELEQAQTFLDQAAAGSGAILFLTGEPGIRKTRMAQEVAGRAAEAGFIVACGRCYENERSSPYYPLFDVLADIYSATPEVVRNAIKQRWPYLSRLLPDTEHAASNGALSGLEDEQSLFRATTSFLRTLSEFNPIAILIDDLQWSDESNLKLLLHAARHLRGAPVAIIGTYRDVDVGRLHPLAIALTELQREKLLNQFVLGRLSEPGTRALLERSLHPLSLMPRLAARVHHRTTAIPSSSRRLVGRSGTLQPSIPNVTKSACSSWLPSLRCQSACAASSNIHSHGCRLRPRKYWWQPVSLADVHVWRSPRFDRPK